MEAGRRPMKVIGVKHIEGKKRQRQRTSLWKYGQKKKVSE
jgi:hypothetical protein